MQPQALSSCCPAFAACSSPITPERLCEVTDRRNARHICRGQHVFAERLALPVVQEHAPCPVGMHAPHYAPPGKGPRELSLKLAIYFSRPRAVASYPSLVRPPRDHGRELLFACP